MFLAPAWSDAILPGMELKACAKINWDLCVLGRRPDGFHELDTVMVNVSLHDTLTFEPAADLVLTCDDPTLPTDERNLVVKAARALAAASGKTCGARIHLIKRIPAGGGMGGGSSDCACALIGLNRLWNLGWPPSRLHPLAAELGSDVPFFLYGGWRRCRGRGEIVEPLEGSADWPPVRLLLVLTPLHVPTPLVYKDLNAAAWDGKSGGRPLPDVRRSLRTTLTQLAQGALPPDLGLRNDLTTAARHVEPRLEGLQRSLQALCPHRWLMSGSGAVHFVAAGAADEAARLEQLLNMNNGPGIRVCAASTQTTD